MTVYTGEYDEENGDFNLRREGGKWSPESYTSGNLTWGEVGGHTGTLKTTRSIVADVMETAPPLGSSVIEEVGRDLGLFTNNDWEISSEKVRTILEN